VLADLLEPSYGLVRADLHAPQRHALDIAFGIAEPEGADTLDERLLRAATLSCLHELGRAGLTAIAVDDCQWVDSDSAAALTYSLRRLQSEPILCLFSVRAGMESVFDLAQFGDLPVARLGVGPLSLGATQRLLQHELGRTFPRLVIRRLVETSGGNPFYALELARALERGGEPDADDPPPLSRTLDALISERLDGVSDRARELVGVLCLIASGSLQLLDELGLLDGLDESVAARLVQIEGSVVTFAHPLLAAGAHARLGPEERRRLHSALADALDDPVERGRHLAHAAIAPSASSATELSRAAAIAAGRGIPAIAAVLAEAAIRLTPDSDPDGARTRGLLAARFHIQAGAAERGCELLDDLIPELEPGNAHAGALTLRAKATPGIDDQWALLRSALAEADEPATAAEANALLVRNRLYVGDLSGALDAARAADEQAQLTGDVRRVAAATTTRGLMEIWGTGSPDPDVYERARTLVHSGGDLPTDTYSNPQTLLGARGLYRYELDEARGWYALATSAADSAGDVDSSETFLWGLAQLEVRAGRYAAARDLVEQLRESTEPHARRSLSLGWIEGVLAAHAGPAEEARRALAETIERAESGGNWFFVVYGRAALGFLELATGDAAAAIEALDPIASSPLVLDGDPGQTGALSTAAEACVAAGDLERASDLVAHLERRATELDHAWCRGAASRCRGLLLSQRREFEEAFEAFREAHSSFELVTAPLDEARTILALGATQRRARQRRAARESLEAAVHTFEDLGAALWADRARAELGRIGGRTPGSGDLTANERRIAELVSEGKTNKEVAAALFVSDRTVESALTQIYRKLDVRSRTELARKLGAAS
jgi:DNA-binding NarL/FixJ family response regulator